MAIELKNGVFLEIKINDQEIPPSSNVFKSLTMYSGIGYECQSCGTLPHTEEGY